VSSRTTEHASVQGVDRTPGSSTFHALHRLPSTYPIIGKYASSSLGISSPAIGTHFFPNPGGLGGIASPPSPVPVCRPAPMKLCPVGSFSRTVLSVGTEEAATARSALPTGAMDEELVGTSVVVVGDGSEARVGEERRRVDRWDWVM